MTMDSVIIFVPNSLISEESGYLFGVHQEATDSNCDTFYVLGVCKKPQEFYDSGEEKFMLGSYWGSAGDVCLVPMKSNWVLICLDAGELVVQEVQVDQVLRNLTTVRVILYDEITFLQSELFLPPDQQNSTNEKDYFKKLSYCLRSLKPRIDYSKQHPVTRFLDFIIYVCFWFHYLFLKCKSILKFTTLGLHLNDCITNMVWMMKDWKKERRISIKAGNYLTSLMIDLFGGMVLLHLLKVFAHSEEIFNFISSTTEEIINSIILLVEWLMGSPAGLKLNHPLNQILGGFFVYNINLWWKFLGLMRPALEFFYFVFLKLGLLGITFQIAIVADIFTIVTFHVYCIYVYAARLYGLQINGLCSLSRLFLGRNRNPEPGRVDSCPYTTEQLFVGTISFTVLLFLFPTTMVYYIVFVVLRLGVISISGLMTRVRFIIQALPLYSTYLWLFYPNYTTVTVKILPQRGKSHPNNLILFAKPVCISLFETAKLSVPEIINTPPPIQWQSIISSMVSGKLINPL